MSEGQGTATKTGAPDPLLGRVIADRFKITSLIARGGMGKVYRAEQAPLGRVCAVKVLNPNYNGDADPEFHKRFFREASITSKITHPNSVTIFDYGKTDDEIYFMAMEYLEGQTLHMALREGGVMHEIRVGRITSQICRALREAHKLGVIHRDLKPANIFLTRSSSRGSIPDGSGAMPSVSEEDDDFVKVLDFGLVKLLEEKPEEQLTQTGLFMGSPKYMAPEQIQGGVVDERTDIYSLGIIMYEMLAGKVPFERATSVNILMAHVGEPPPPMRAVNPNLICSPAFEEIVMSCISKDPNARLSSMDQLLQAIRRAHGGSMTGQLPAVNMSGPWAPVAATSAPPPAVVSSAPGLTSPGMTGPIAPGAVTGASGSHSMEILRAPASNDIATGEIAALRPRSKLWIVFGVLAAAVIGGGLGMVAFRWSGSESNTIKAPAISATPVSPSVPVSASREIPPPPPAVSASASSTPPADKKTFTVTTEPAGAAIREDGKDLCPATPCELAFKTEGPEAAKPHKLVIVRAGYKPEIRTVKASDPPLNVKLTHASNVRVQPQPQPQPPTTTTAKDPTPAPKPEPTTPNGFKDQPY